MSNIQLTSQLPQSLPTGCQNSQGLYQSKTRSLVVDAEQIGYRHVDRAPSVDQ